MTTQVTDPGPLDWRTSIVDKSGRPSPEFQRRWNTNRANTALIGTITFGEGPPPADPVPGDGAEYADTSTMPFTLYVGQGGVWNLATPQSANPTATAGHTAINGTADTFMRSDAAPAIALATTGTFGLVKPDGATVDVSSGVISVPIATTSTPGLVKPDGTTIDISSGRISVPLATTSSPGLVEPDGSTITISGGIISSTATGGGSSNLLGCTALYLPADVSLGSSTWDTITSWAVTTDPLHSYTAGNDHVVAPVGATYVRVSMQNAWSNAGSAGRYAGVFGDNAFTTNSKVFVGDVRPMQNESLSNPVGVPIACTAGDLMYPGYNTGGSTGVSLSGLSGSNFGRPSRVVFEWYSSYPSALVPGGGTVTSVNAAVPSEFTVSGGPIVSAGTLTITKSNQTANTVWAGPSSGGAASPTFRTLTTTDIPSLSSIYLPVASNAVSASKWATARTFTYTGDATGSSSVDGSANVSTSLTLATVNSNVGSYGSGTQVPVITVNGKGLITAVSSANITAGVSSFNTRTGSVTLTSTDVTTALGFTPGTGNGTVTSVGMTVPGALLSVAGSAVTTSGTLAVSLVNQSANQVFAGPSSGSAMAPAFRSLVANDIPALTYIAYSGSQSLTGSQKSQAVVNLGLIQSNNNTSLGSNTILTPTTGYNNSSLGAGSLQNVTSGASNAAMGAGALNALTTGSNNMGIGSNTFQSITSGSNNTGVGSQVFASSTGSNNVGVGALAGYNSTSGSYNTAIGYEALLDLSSGTNNIGIGFGVDVPSPTGSNQLSIQNIIYGTNNGNYGSTVSTGQIGIGTKTPRVTLDVAGPVATVPTTYAGLPAPSTCQGARAFITDCNLGASGNFGASILGGGSNGVPVYSDGTNWRIG